jgi:O-methyltransferase
MLSKGDYKMGSFLNRFTMYKWKWLRHIVIEIILKMFIFDFNRIAVLKLVAREIKNKKLQGCAAELGVYRGNFAKHLNRLFPDAALYLFDTFAGFDKRDVKIDNDSKFSTIGSAENDFHQPSIDLVMRKMKHPEKCIIKKGYFPETAQDVDEQFVFVSIDPDLYEPIYQGLRFFYPRLVAGGYIFVHDCRDEFFSGAKQAVKRFAEEAGVSYFPMNDIARTCVFMK